MKKSVSIRQHELRRFWREIHVLGIEFCLANYTVKIMLNGHGDTVHNGQQHRSATK